MINKFSISGTIGDIFDYTSVYCGNDLSRETYFYDLNPKDASTHLRFFSRGNEIRLHKNGIEHIGNGGIICEYMFGTDIPFADLIRPNIINRLVLYGTYYNRDRNVLVFKHSTDGTQNYESLFMEGNAVTNWFFFLSPKYRSDIIEKQRWILKHAGRFLKSFKGLSSTDDSIPLALADSIIKKLPEEDIQLFLLRLTDKKALEYSNEFRKILDRGAIPDPSFISDFDKRFSFINEKTRKRIKLDSIYKHSAYKRIIDTYILLLAEAQKFKSLPQSVQNYLSRYKRYIERKNIPKEIYLDLEKKLPVKFEHRDVDNYIEEFKLIFYNLLLTEYCLLDDLIDEDLKVLLKIKHRAFLDSNKDFEQILIDAGKKLDETRNEETKIRQMDTFSKVITYFDLYDSCSAEISRIIYGEASPESAKLISLAKNMERFNRLDNDLFRNLFIDPVRSNRYLTSYGLKKIDLLAFGLEEILRTNKTVSELYEEIAAINEEETIYKILTEKVRHITSGQIASYSTPEQRSELNQKIGSYVSLGENTRRRIPERLLNKVVQDYNLEIVYFTETIPAMILKDDWEQRRDFIQNSGLDIFRIEQIEKIYCSRNGLKSNYIESIAASKLKLK